MYDNKLNILCQRYSNNSNPVFTDNCDSLIPLVDIILYLELF